jgi:long-chain acyl-CoA synthetase
VKRKQVVAELQKLERAAQSGEKAREKAATAQGGILDWLVPLLADVTQRPAADIRPDSRLTVDLGLDSLMLTELSVALEQAGVPLAAVNDLTSLQTVEDLRKLVQQSGRRAAVEEKKVEVVAEEKKPQSQLEVDMPDALAELGRSVIRMGQRIFYGGLYDVKVSGRNFVPQNRNFLVVANHASHLDMGLVKVVLGEQGKRLTALAARDYFFDTPAKRAFFENFTDLIPMDRSGSLRESLRMAGEALNQGYNLLIFPEGTRSASGELLEFKPTLGYLALSHKVDVLPLYLEGTYDALPRGTMVPKKADLRARIGPVIRYQDVKARAAGMSKSESYRLATRLVEESVKSLRDGQVSNWEQLSALPLDVEKPRKSAGGDA